MRNSALASAALTSVALLAQTANAAPSLGDEAPSREEVSRKVSSLYDQAESDTGTFNATRAAAGARGRADRPADAGRGPAASPRKDEAGRGDPALDSVARQWFDAARSKLGPTVPAVLPRERGERPSGPRSARTAERAPGNLAELGRSTSDRPALALPAAPVAEPVSAATGTSPVAELTAGPLAALPSATETSPETTGETTGALPALQVSRTTQSALALPAPTTSSVERAAEVTAGATDESRQRSALKASKERNQRKIEQARALLSAHTAQRTNPPAAIEPAPTTPPVSQTWDSVAALPADTWSTTQTPAADTWTTTTQTPAADTWTTTTQTPATDTWTTTTAPTDTWATAETPATGTWAITETPATDTWATTETPATPADTWTTTQAPAPDTWTTTQTPATDTWTNTPASSASPADPWATPQAPAVESWSITQTSAALDTRSTTPTPSESSTGTQWQVLQDLRSVEDLAPTAADTSTWSSTASRSTETPVAPPAPVPPLTTSQTSTAGQGPTAGAPAPAPSSAQQDSRATRALEFARAQLGKPCVWGTTGPEAFDAAGLTQAAWKAAGITLPRTPQEQATAGRGIAVPSAEPGDLVLFHAGHVGICSGNGMMIHAPGPGAVIREESMHYAGESAIHSVVRPA
ncbi:NlpC/P60 family protein [Streptomyces sp. NPDC007808]|uniref:NlpC/P60 family protein n=1 Tax=Streptomyces sp. NPDC007808 TaxID=3364779 RepID=UPI003676F705